MKHISILCVTSGSADHVTAHVYVNGIHKAMGWGVCPQHATLCAVRRYRKLRTTFHYLSVWDRLEVNLRMWWFQTLHVLGYTRSGTL